MNVSLRLYPLNNMYAASPCGLVYSLDYRNTGQPCILSQNKHSLGYVRVTIGGKATGVHVIIARTYLPNPDNLPEVDHIDGDKTNNSINNLRWVSHGDNIRHGMKRMGNWLKNAPKKTTSIQSYTGHNSTVKTYISIMEASKDHGVKYPVFAPAICRAIKHDWRAYGLRWRRLN